jgi:hypothetical protein
MKLDLLNEPGLVIQSYEIPGIWMLKADLLLICEDLRNLRE